MSCDVQYDATCLTCGADLNPEEMTSDQSKVERWMLDHLAEEPLHSILFQMVASQIVVTEKGFALNVASMN